MGRGKAFCRVVGEHGVNARVVCTLSNSSNPQEKYCGQTVESGVLDEGYNSGRAFVELLQWRWFKRFRWFLGI